MNDHGSTFSGAFQARKGFTLLEILVAVAVFMVIMSIFINIVGGVSNTWSRGQGQNERRSNGRALLQYISRELQQVSLPLDYASVAGTGAPAAPADLQFIVSTTGGTTVIPAADLNPHAVFWQAPIAHNTSSGELAAIGYFIKWDTFNGRPRAQLCRYFAEPSTSSAYLVYQSNGNAPQNWLQNIGTIAPASSNDPQGWFADNVIALWIRCLDAYGQPITKTAAGSVLNNGYGFDSRQGYIDSKSVVHPAPALPAAVQIALVTLDDTTAKRLVTPITATPTTPAAFQSDINNFMANLDSRIKPGAQVFTTTVWLPNSRP